MARRSKRPEPPEECSQCGTAVPRTAWACPECGADENTGWDANPYLPDEGFLDLPEDDDAEYDPARDGPVLPHETWARGFWKLVAIVVLTSSRWPCSVCRKSRPMKRDDLKRMLESAGIRPRRPLGQNFLTDPNLVKAIARDAEIEATDVVLEVGTGTAGLTQHLADAAAHVDRSRGRSGARRADARADVRPERTSPSSSATCSRRRAGSPTRCSTRSAASWRRARARACASSRTSLTRSRRCRRRRARARPAARPRDGHGAAWSRRSASRRGRATRPSTRSRSSCRSSRRPRR